MSTLRRKVETGFAAFLGRLDDRALEGHGFYESSIAKKRALPGFGLRAYGETEAFPGGSPRRLTLEIAALTQMDDTENGEVPNDDTRAEIRDLHDRALSAVEAALDAPGAPAAIMAALNVGAVKRPVEGFHFYDITKMNESQLSDEGRLYSDSLVFEIVCQNCDGA